MSETAEKRRANKGSFSKASPRPGPGRGKRKPIAAAGNVIAADMERAYSTAETPEDPTIVKALRRMAHENPEKFLTLYARMKGPESAAPPAAAATEAREMPASPKELKVEELAERLLSDWAEEEAFRAGRDE
jgi:hypothetical protein